VDGSHEAIVKALRAAGCTVQSLAVCGGGAPDLLVGYRGSNHLLEVKLPHKSSKLNDAQREWHRVWRGIVTVVRSPEQALEAVGASLSPSGPLIRSGDWKPSAT
jgi:hypothetical protein